MIKGKLKLGDMVVIEWEDSYGCSSRWEEISGDSPPQTMLCRSVGWVTSVNEKCVVIVPHIAENSKLDVRQGIGDMAIPQRSITHVKRVGT